MLNKSAVVTRRRFAQLTQDSQRVIREAVGKPYGLPWGRLEQQLIMHAGVRVARSVELDIDQVIGIEIHNPKEQP